MERGMVSLKQTDGLSDASEFGALNTIRNNDSITIKLNPFIKTNSLLKVFVDGEIYHEEVINLSPMDVFSSKIFLDETLPSIVGIKSIAPAIASSVYKFETYWTPFANEA